MGWNPFRKPEPTPLYDLVRKPNQETVNGLLEEKPDERATLCKVIAHLDMMAAATFVCSLHEFKLKPVNVDVITFEALAFSAWAIHQHFNPLPDPSDPDYDDLIDDYDDAFDEGLSDSFKLGHSVVVGLVERATDWTGLDAIWNRRYMHYGLAKTYQEAVDRFIANVLICRASARPHAAYEAVPPINFEIDRKIMISAMSFADTMPPGYAETLNRIVDAYHFREV